MMGRVMRFLLLILTFLLPGAGWRAAAAEHLMHGASGDPLAVPLWDDFFAAGPFRRPDGAARDAAACCREGWRAVFRLDDGLAEQWFRSALQSEPDNVEAMVGLAAANAELPGRAAAAARRAASVAGRVDGSWQAEVAAAWVESHAALPMARASDGAARAELLAAAGRPRFEAAAARRRLIELLAVPASREAIPALLLARLICAAEADASPERVASLLARGEKAFPDHAMRWLRTPAAAAPVPPSGAAPGSAAAEAWAHGLERTGWLREAAAWHAHAAGLAGQALRRDPADQRAMTALHEALCGQARALASAGDRDAATETARAAGPDCVRETSLRCEAWDELSRVTAAGEAAAGAGKALIEWRHARALAAVRRKDLPAVFAALAPLREAVDQWRRAPGQATPEGVLGAVALVREIEAWLALAQGQSAAAAALLPEDPAGLPLPAARAAALMAACGRRAEALTLFAKAEPAGLPEAAAARAAGLEVPAFAELQPRWQRPRGEPAWEPTMPPAARWVPPAAPELKAAPSTGGIRVVIFFLGYRCDHCLRQLDIFRLWEPRLRAAGASLTAVSVDPPERVAETFAGPDRSKREPYPFPVLPDPALETFRAWGAWDHFDSRPVHATCVVDAEGRLRWQACGTEPFYDAAAVLRLVEAIRIGG